MNDEQLGPESDSIVQEEPNLQSETWQEPQELPPDDFQDPYQTEEATAVETEEPPPSASPFEAGKETKRSKGVILASLFVVCGIAIGVFLFNQMSGDKGSPPPQPGAVEKADRLPGDPETKTPARDATESAKKAEPFVTPTTGETDMKALYEAAVNKAATSAGSAAALPSGPTIDQETGEPATPALVRPDDIMVKQAAKAPAGAAVPDTSKTGVNVAPALQNQAVPVAQADFEDRLKTLSGQVEDLKKVLEQTSRQAEQLAARLDETAQGGPAATAAKGGAGLEARLDKIEQQLASLVGGQAGASKTKPLQDVGVYEPSGEMEAVSPPASDKQEASSKPPASTKAAKRKTAKPRSVASRAGTKTVKSGGWVLRAATPEAAWVAKSKESVELQEVRVGDTLSGIGKVRSIHQVGDSWTIVGSKGSIH